MQMDSAAYDAIRRNTERTVTNTLHIIVREQTSTLPHSSTGGPCSVVALLIPRMTHNTKLAVTEYMADAAFSAVGASS